MDKPQLTDYATLIFTLFDKFEQEGMKGSAKIGKPYTFGQKCFIVLFVILQFRHIFEFKAQRHWLEEHPEMLSLLNNMIVSNWSGSKRPWLTSMVLT